MHLSRENRKVLCFCSIMTVTKEDFMDLTINKSNLQRHAFGGNIHKSVQKIFKDLQKDIPHAKVYEETTGKTIDISAGDVYQKLSDYVAGTGDNVELYWQKHTLKDLFSLKPPYSGFMFRDKSTKNQIRGSKYPDILTFKVFHNSEKYIDEDGITAQAPNIRQENRKQLTGHHSKYAEYLKNYYSDYVLVRTPYDSYYEMVNPAAAFFWTLVDGFIKAIPKIKTNHYGERELRDMNRWVDELTTHTTPEDVNKLLNIK